MRLQKSPIFFSLFFATALGCTNSGVTRFSPQFAEQQKNQEQSAPLCGSSETLSRLQLESLLLLMQSPLELRISNLLAQVVTESGSIKYLELAQDANKLAELSELVDTIAHLLPTGEVTSASKAQLINLYNLFTLKVIIENYDKLLGGDEAPLAGEKSILNIDSLGFEVWNQKKVATSRGKLSLNEIEQLLKGLNDNRFHFAINCASNGCPPLLNRAFTAELLNEQLLERTCHFVNSGEQTIFDNLDLSQPVVYTSQILNWYGAEFGDLHQFLFQFSSSLNRDLANGLVSFKSSGERLWKIEFQEYSWSLNEEVN